MKKTKKHLKRCMALLLVMVLAFSLCSAALALDVSDDIGKSTERLKGFQSDEFRRSNDYEYASDEQVRAIIVMDGKPTADNKNFIDRLSNGEKKLVRQHEKLMDTMEKQSVDYELNFEYTTLLNGISVTVEYGQLDKIAQMSGVEAVYIANHYDVPVVGTNSASAGEMTGTTWLHGQLSGDGSGTLIAVLDTGITAQHEAFRAYDGMLETPAYTKQSAITAIAQLGHGAYYSQKIPYQYDYYDNDNNANDDASGGGGHGTHVAGIAAGYACDGEGVISFSGAAPDAQILAMKVFTSGGSSGTSSDIYFAALEDAYISARML